MEKTYQERNESEDSRSDSDGFMLCRLAVREGRLETCGHFVCFLSEELDSSIGFEVGYSEGDSWDRVGILRRDGICSITYNSAPHAQQ